MEHTIIGVDISKNVFSIHGKHARGKAVFCKKASRGDFLSVLENYPGSVVAMETCGGANHWGRELQQRGFEVRLLAPRHVKPYVRSQKNDYADAEAIAEAASRERVRVVPVKDITQQDLQTLHRLREHLVKQITAQVNMLRGLLMEYGIVMPQGIRHFRNRFCETLESNESNLTRPIYGVFKAMFESYRMLEEQLDTYTSQLEQIAKNHPVAKRLMTIPGIGPITATALLTINISGCKNGRNLGAMLGLVPSQYSTGGKERLGRITKRGNKYLRKILVQGARAVLVNCHRHQTAYFTKAYDLKKRLGYNKAAVAMANRNTRIAYRILTTDEMVFRDTVLN